MPGQKKDLKGTRKGKAPPGAKTRATTALMGKKFTETMAPEALRAFWSAAVMKIPPPLRTSFGNFTVVNSVCRVTVSSSTTLSTYLWIPWSPSPLAAMQFAGTDNVAVTQHLYTTLTTGTPLAMRPLRMSFTMSNITQMVNTAGDVRIYSLDNAIRATFTTGATSAAAVLKNVTADTELGPLIDGSPDTVDIPIASMLEEQEWVSVPCSFPGYNAYYDFIDFANTSQGSNMISLDLYTLARTSQAVTSETFPVSSPVTTGVSGGTGLGSVPPMRGFLIRIPATPSGVQSIRFEFRRQDGARYPVNTLGHSFAMDHAKMSASGEDKFIAGVKDISQNPAHSVHRSVMERFTGVAHRLSEGLA